MRVLVSDPSYPLELVRGIVPEARPGPVADGGPGVVCLLTGPDAPVAAADIGRMPDLRLIATASVGIDHIDLEAAAARGIDVRNVPDYCSDEVADHALAMLLALRRNVVDGDRSVQRGEWDWEVGGMPGRIAGTRLALVGVGRIGAALRERAEALGMAVRFFDPALPGGDPDLDTLLSWAEAVSLHAPLTEKTRGMIDARRLALLRPGAILVNTARGALVDREALLGATHLKAAIDTPWERPPLPDLLGHPHIVITPYVAWLSPATLELPYERAAQAAAEFLASL